MVLNEFSLIRHYFTGIGASDPDVALAVGDDAALLHRTSGGYWAVAADMLVEGRHFPHNSDPALVAARALRVNLSDMAAMGARPRFFSMTISLPQADSAWLQAFSDSLQQESHQFGVSLLGGDTTAGPFTLSLQMIGEVNGNPLLRSTAQAGDDIWVTGQLGGAAAFVAADFTAQSTDDFAWQRFWKPEPRIAFALEAAPYISAAIDVSDGLWADLGHICEQSRLGAQVQLAKLPLHPQLQQRHADSRIAYALTGGDDYELCFSAAPDQRQAIEQVAAQQKLQVTRIGQLTEQLERLCLGQDGQALTLQQGGYQHF